MSAVWWAARLVATGAGLEWPSRAPLASVHGLLFSMGSMPLFIAGFAFTAGPKWLKRPGVPASPLRWPVWLFAAGWAIAIVGVDLDLILAACGLALSSLAWAVLTYFLCRLVAGSPPRDRVHLTGIALACVGMGICLAASSLAFLSSHLAWLTDTLQIGLWSVVAVFLLASHRMLPFVGARLFPRLDARWPLWPLWLLVSVPVTEIAEALLALANARSRLGTAMGALVLAVAAAVCLQLALRLRHPPGLRQPLVAMLYGAFLWWDVSLWLGAAAGWPWLSDAGSAALGMAQIHAMGLGFLGGTLLTMASRISSAHSGRPQAIDTLARLLYGALQTAIVMRLGAVLWPPAAALLLPLAACMWMGIASVWAVRHGRWMGCPRADGRPSGL